jgi:transcriptional regulator with XRE-family HTH domain
MVNGDHDNKVIGARVRALMEQRGVSNKFLVEETGYADSTISMLLKGERSWNNRNIASVSRALGVRPADLFGDPEDELAAAMEEVRTLNEEYQAALMAQIAVYKKAQRAEEMTKGLETESKKAHDGEGKHKKGKKNDENP